MGRMKEVFMQMREDNWQGEPNEYLKQYVNKDIKEEYNIHMTDMLCPNCFQVNLFQVSEHELYCEVCAYEFVQVDNAIRFK